MERNWILFQRNTDDGDGREHIFLDLHARRHTSSSQYPHLLSLFINIYHIAENDDQAKWIQKELNEIEEKLDKEMQASGDGVLIGRMDSPKRLQFLFYVEEPEAAQKRMLRMMQSYSTYRHYIQVREDAEWTYYTQLLPNQEEKMIARNRQILRSLDYEGYKTNVAQRVHHQLLFDTKVELDEVKDQLAALHYRIEHFDYDPQGLSREYRLQVSHEVLLNEQALNQCTQRLHDMITTKGGKYEGWGIIPQEKITRKWRLMLQRSKAPVVSILCIVICSALMLFMIDSHKAVVRPSEPVSNPLAVGKMAPTFKLRDQNDNMVQIGKTGHPQVLHFCDASLEPCREDLQQLETLAAQAKGKAEVISVCFPHPAAHPPEQETSFPVVEDQEHLDAYRAYQVKRFPVTFFINSSGKIVDVVEAGKPGQHDRSLALNELK